MICLSRPMFCMGCFLLTAKQQKGEKKMTKNETNQVMKNRSNTRTLTGMAMMAALSIVILLVIPKFPIFPAAPYLVYDMADVPIIMSTFMFGPGAGVMVLAVVSVIQALTMSADGWVGAVMHILASGALILVAYFVAAKIGKTKGMIIGLLCGTIAMTLMMIPLNLIVTVHIYGQPQDVVLAAMIPAIIPFNFLKAAINSAIFFVCYKLINISKPGLFKFGR